MANLNHSFRQMNVKKLQKEQKTAEKSFYKEHLSRQISSNLNKGNRKSRISMLMLMELLHLESNQSKLHNIQSYIKVTF